MKAKPWQEKEGRQEQTKHSACRVSGVQSTGVVSAGHSAEKAQLPLDGRQSRPHGCGGW